MKISKLYKIDDTPVFYSITLNSIRQKSVDGLLDGSMIGYATDGSVMEPLTAVDDFIRMADFADGEDNVEKVYRNMEIAKVIVAVVKAELLPYSDGEQYLYKLINVINALRTGSFQTAATLLKLIECDEVITEERIIRWFDLCLTSDSFKI